MMFSEEFLIEQLREIISGTDIFIVDIILRPNNQIIVKIDNNQGISINDCANISRSLERRLSEEDDIFELQVSSPGLDSPFKVIDQYKKNIGREVEIIENDGIKRKGKILRIIKDGIEVEEKKRNTKNKKQEIVEQKEIFFKNIKSTKIVPEF